MNRRLTITLGTETTFGFIRHLKIHAPGLSIEAPVALSTHNRVVECKTVEGEHLPIPRMRDGRLLYALPGGSVITGDAP